MRDDEGGVDQVLAVSGFVFLNPEIVFRQFLSCFAFQKLDGGFL